MNCVRETPDLPPNELTLAAPPTRPTQTHTAARVATGSSRSRDCLLAGLAGGKPSSATHGLPVGLRICTDLRRGARGGELASALSGLLRRELGLRELATPAGQLRSTMPGTREPALAAAWLRPRAVGGTDCCPTRPAPACRSTGDNKRAGETDLPLLSGDPRPAFARISMPTVCKTLLQRKNQSSGEPL
eukprot:9407300-Lingulodinium_polyedra.AAC.1